MAVDVVNLVFVRNSTMKHLLKLGMKSTELEHVMDVKKYLSDEDLLDFIAFNRLISNKLKPAHVAEQLDYYANNDPYFVKIAPLMELGFKEIKDKLADRLETYNNNIDEPLFTIEHVSGTVYVVSVSDSFYKFVSGNGKLDFLIDILTVANKFTKDSILFNAFYFKCYLHWLALKVTRR
jgi:hypothetical protein